MHASSSPADTRYRGQPDSICSRTRRTWKRWWFSTNRDLLLGHVALRRFDEGLEERPELTGAPEVLWMPLDTETEGSGRIFDGLDHSIWSGRRGLKPGGDLLDGLMVAAVHVARVGPAESIVHQAREKGVLVDPDLVSQRVGLVGWDGQAMLECPGDLGRDVLNQIAAKGDVQELDASANRQERNPSRSGLAHKRDFEVVALTVDVDG